MAEIFYQVYPFPLRNVHVRLGGFTGITVSSPRTFFPNINILEQPKDIACLIIKSYTWTKCLFPFYTFN